MSRTRHYECSLLLEQDIGGECVLFRIENKYVFSQTILSNNLIVECNNTRRLHILAVDISRKFQSCDYVTFRVFIK